MGTATHQRPLTTDQILRIANEDAINVYRDVSDFRITITRRSDGWHVVFEPDDPNVHSGGPHYVIDPADGTIISKKYYQ